MALKRDLRSRQWSCSSLVGAHQELLAAKMECHGSEDDEMEAEIKAPVTR